MTKPATTKLVKTSPSEKAVRIEKALERANTVFEDEQSANLWLTTENRTLGGIAPLELLNTDAGYESVLNALAQIEHGVIS